MSESVERTCKRHIVVFLVFLAAVLAIDLVAQEEEPVQDAAQAFLKEARALYEIPMRDGLKSFGLEITVYSKARTRRDLARGDVTITYEWEAPETEDFALEGSDNQLRRAIAAPLRGLWKDIAGACVFPDLDGDGLSVEGNDEGMVLSRSPEEGSATSVLFDPATKLVLKAEQARGDAKIIIAPSYVPSEGLLRLEGKVVSVTGGGGEGTEGSYVYGGFRDVEGYCLPTQLSVNLGANEVEMGFKYVHINGARPEGTGFDPEVVKTMIKDFEKAYSKWSNPEKIDGMKKLAVTEDEKAAEAIAKKGVKDKDLTVREEAVTILGRMGCRSVVSDLTKAMKSNEDNLEVYLALIAALGDIGDPKGIPSLSKDFWNQKEAVTGIRVANAKIAALGKIRSKKSVDALVDMLFVAGPGAMGRLSRSLTQSLESLTGQQFGWDRDRWKDWWKQNKSKFKLEEDK